TMPDEELFRLAGRKELRTNLATQVKRMMADSRSEALIQNFTGQWLQVRDLQGIAINARVVFARDAGVEKQMRQRREEFIARQAKGEEEKRRGRKSGQPAAATSSSAGRRAVPIQAAVRAGPGVEAGDEKRNRNVLCRNCEAGQAGVGTD